MSGRTDLISMPKKHRPLKRASAASRKPQPAPAPIPPSSSSSSSDSEQEEEGAMFPAVSNEDDLLAGIAAFMAPGSQDLPASQLQLTQPADMEEEDSSSSGEEAESDAASLPSNSIPTTKNNKKTDRKPKTEQGSKTKRGVKRKNNDSKEGGGVVKRNKKEGGGDAGSVAGEEPGSSSDSGDSDSADSTSVRSQHKLRNFSRQLRYLAGHGFLHTSLPMLVALIRERCLQFDLPSAASALQHLYPAYKLDINTLFKCSVFLLDRHAEAAGGGLNSHPGARHSHNHLTRFYRKIINLSPKNRVQVVLELAYQFMAHDQLTEAFDHLSHWHSSPLLTLYEGSLRTADAAAERKGDDDDDHPLPDPRARSSRTLEAAKVLTGMLALVSWACAQQARRELDKWQRAMQVKEAGEDEDEDEEEDEDGDSSSRPPQEDDPCFLARTHTLSDLRLEIRTAHQKVTAFDKLARAKLRAALAADPANGLWVWSYLECMAAFYNESMKGSMEAVESTLRGTTITPQEQTLLDSTPKRRDQLTAKAALQSRLKAAQQQLSVAQRRAKNHATKIVALQQRLVTKVDGFIAADREVAGGHQGAAGFHIKLYYMHLFTHSPANQLLHFIQGHPHICLTPQERQERWVATRQLLHRDPLSNLAIEQAWTLWVDQGEMERPPVYHPKMVSTASFTARSWCIRAEELIDVFANRLDSYPEEVWSWQALTRLLARSSSLREVTRKECPVWSWPMPGSLSSSHPSPSPTPSSDLESDSESVVSGGGQSTISRHSSTSTPSLSSLASSPAMASLAAAFSPKVSENKAGAGKKGGKGAEDSSSSSSSSSSDSDDEEDQAMKQDRKHKKEAAKAAKVARTSSDVSSEISTPRTTPISMPGAPVRSISSGATQTSAETSSQAGTSSTAGNAEAEEASQSTARSYSHNLLSSLPIASDSYRRNHLWPGRIEWWVQSELHWRDVPPLHPMEVPPQLPEDPAAKLLMLRGVSYWLVLHWMGWMG